MSLTLALMRIDFSGLVLTLSASAWQIIFNMLPYCTALFGSGSIVVSLWNTVVVLLPCMGYLGAAALTGVIVLTSDN